MLNLLQSSLSNERVHLRPLQLSDTELLRPLAADPDLWVYGLSDLSKAEELEKYVAKAVRDRDEKHEAAVWIIIDQESGKAAGCTRLAEISWKDKRGQIGWTWLGKAFQGSGLNKAMKFLILDFGFSELGLNRIELKADARNERSRAAIRKIGAREEGILRQHMATHDGHLRDTVFYSILAHEWPQIRQERFAEFSQTGTNETLAKR